MLITITFLHMTSFHRNELAKMSWSLSLRYLNEDEHDSFERSDQHEQLLMPAACFQAESSDTHSSLQYIAHDVELR